MDAKSMAQQQVLHVYDRPDGKHDWHLIVNGNVVATSGGQGYEKPVEALRMGRAVCRGDFSGAHIRIGGAADAVEDSAPIGFVHNSSIDDLGPVEETS